MTWQNEQMNSLWSQTLAKKMYRIVALLRQRSELVTKLEIIYKKNQTTFFWPVNLFGWILFNFH